VEVEALTAQLAAAKEKAADLDKRLIETTERADAAERALHEHVASLHRRVEEMVAAGSAGSRTAAVDDAGDRAGKKPGSGRGRGRGKAASPTT
jgi:hypothetical protein